MKIKFMGIVTVAPPGEFVSLTLNRSLYGRIDLKRIGFEADMHDAITGWDAPGFAWECSINGVVVAKATTPAGAAARGEKWLRALLTPLVNATTTLIEERTVVFPPERAAGILMAKSVIANVFLPGSDEAADREAQVWSQR